MMNRVDDKLRDREDATHDVPNEDSCIRQDKPWVGFALSANESTAIIHAPSQAPLQTSIVEALCGVLRQGDGFRAL